VNYETLKPLVTSALAAHPDWSAQQVADHLNDPAQASVRSFEHVTEKGVASAYGLAFAATVKAKLQAVADAGNAGVAMALDWLRPEGGGIDMGDPATVEVLDQLQAGGVLNEEEVTKAKVLGFRACSLAEQVGLGTILDTDVEIALGTRPLVQRS